MRLTILLFLISGFTVSAQSWKFRKEAQEVMEPIDSVFVIDTVAADIGPYDFVADSAEALHQLFLYELLDISRNRPDTLTQSENLTRMATLATKYWKGSQYVDDKKWRKLNKYFRRASNLTSFNFNLMEQVSFRVPLVDDMGESFYYDAKGNADGLNLYTGKRPKTKEERESQIALTNYSQEEITALFLRMVDRKIVNNLKKGNIAFVGMSVELDKKTLYKTRIPTVRVVIVFGAKRFRLIPDRYRTEE